MGNLTQKIRNQAPYVYQVKEQIAFIRCPDPAWKFNQIVDLNGKDKALIISLLEHQATALVLGDASSVQIDSKVNSTSSSFPIAVGFGSIQQNWLNITKDGDYQVDLSQIMKIEKAPFKRNWVR